MTKKASNEPATTIYLDGVAFDTSLIKTIILSYSGCGDSGATDGIVVQDDTVTLTGEQYDVIGEAFNKQCCEFDDWWNNDGGGGEALIHLTENLESEGPCIQVEGYLNESEQKTRRLRRKEFSEAETRHRADTPPFIWPGTVPSCTSIAFEAGSHVRPSLLHGTSVGLSDEQLGALAAYLDYLDDKGALEAVVSDAMNQNDDEFGWYMLCSLRPDQHGDWRVFVDRAEAIGTVTRQHQVSYHFSLDEWFNVTATAPTVPPTTKRLCKSVAKVVDRL